MMALPLPYLRIAFREGDLGRLDHPLADCIAQALAMVHTLRVDELIARAPVGYGVVFHYGGLDVFVDRRHRSVSQVLAEYVRLQQAHQPAPEPCRSFDGPQMAYRH